MEPNRNDRRTAWVKTFGDVIAEYAYHPESKYADEHGNPSDRQTIGLLQRRHVRIAEIVPIGKESNHLEEVDAGLIHSPDAVSYTHLDVYKRQEMCMRGKSAAGSHCWQ